MVSEVAWRVSHLSPTPSEMVPDRTEEPMWRRVFELEVLLREQVVINHLQGEAIHEVCAALEMVGPAMEVIKGMVEQLGGAGPPGQADIEGKMNSAKACAWAISNHLNYAVEQMNMREHKRGEGRNVLNRRKLNLDPDDNEFAVDLRTSDGGS